MDNERDEQNTQKILKRQLRIEIVDETWALSCETEGTYVVARTMAKGKR